MRFTSDLERQEDEEGHLWLEVWGDAKGFATARNAGDLLGGALIGNWER